MIKRFFYISVVVLIAYSGVQLGMPYYHYYGFKSDIEELSKVSINFRPKDVAERTMEIVRRHNVPLEKDDISLIKNERYIIMASWEETVDLFGVYKKTYVFSIDTSELH